ncbi:hypothetical protein MYCTH_2300069 [Thermothelomyces thermophilus ATCC 42464]|uniref:Uncharacterized protein n=1 Tax=Thermothelomyces thermophilus (strain ATCC 42464 / BCRC 31852 / DSM 1799) TaxID=573729 RepID=G2QA87_THET4|nr:uncharacterized protein MYCTH_2300069 [Thermothelomyces thermophilus ATCC 42464]AEO55835.1 hypothetical protein MYCTH_2300069 [Thermothelomyces thermophilus ATCC 42464]
MALLPDWLLRLRRVEPADNPVLAVEKLNSLGRPLQDADKEILVGAVLTMSSSLHLALDMLQEILPQEKSQERLGEVMCPTLGSLLDSLQSTLSSFARSTSRQAPPPEASATPPASTPGTATPRAGGANVAGEHHHHHLSTPRSRHSGHGGRAAVKESEQFGSAGFSRPQTARTETERFPPFEDSRTAGRLDHTGINIRRRPAENLVNALQAEMRVQAAINVAIESLEFAEGQLKMVKEVNRLHGGNFDLLQRHFYQGYNRLLSRALELQWREMGLQSSRDSLISVASVEQPCPQLARHAATTTNNTGMRARPRQHSISFQSVSSVQSPASTTRGYGETRTPGFQRRSLERRNTIQGIRQEGKYRWCAPPPKAPWLLSHEPVCPGC